MFHLTRYKYWFFGISLLVIVPGLLALIFWHLNLGIDLTGGSLIELRFANGNVSTTAVRDAFANPEVTCDQVVPGREPNHAPFIRGLVDGLLHRGRIVGLAIRLGPEVHH